MKNAATISMLAGVVTAALCCSSASPESAMRPSDSPPQKAAPGDNASGQSGDLSEKLDRTNGVIRPDANVDRQMQKSAPDVGTTPVIRPPNATGAEPK